MSIKFVLKQIDASSPAAEDAVIGEYFFNDHLMTVGSDSASTIVVPGGAPEQAVLIREGELVTLINSSDGTSLNDRYLRREAIEPLAVGDEIKIGNFIIFVASGADAALEKTPTVAPLTPAPIDAPDLAADEGEKLLPAEPDNGAESAESKPARSFAEILNTLRTEEDSFYFTVKNGSDEEAARIHIEQAETPLGADARGKICGAAEQITTLLAIVRKDWSGIIIEKQRGGAVLVNDEAIQTSRRLRNGDRINFQTARKLGKKMPALELHEPSSLVALESILEDRSKNGGKIQSGSIKPPHKDNASVKDNAPVKETLPLIERRYFGYFSFFEVAAMTIGTLIAAVLIFLLLEFLIG